MHAPREQTKHTGGVIPVDRLAEDGTFHDHNRVRSQHQIAWPLAPDRERLFARESRRTLARHFPRKRRLVDVRWLHRK
jgi:hypothetical protein